LDGALKEFLSAALAIVSIYGIRRLVEALLGGELVLGRIPISYFADMVDVGVFARMLLILFRPTDEK